MPRRKRNAETPPVASAKKARSVEEPPCLDDIDVQWEYEEKKGHWLYYGKEHAEMLTTAFTAGEVEETLDIKDGVSVKVNFEKMTQKNTRTGWEKRLRCAVKDTTDIGGYHIWQWEDERNEWNAHAAHCCVTLQRGLAKKSASVTIRARDTLYTVDLDSEPWQQMNDEAGVSHEVTIVMSDATAAPVTARANSAAATRSAKAKATGSNVKAASSNVKVAAANGSVARGSGSKSTVKKEEGGKSVRTVVVKGKAPIDPECTAKLKVAHVYYEGNDVYDVMLNQTNLSNNNNKYYLIQLLEDDNRRQYSVWLHWGRVGMKGQNNLFPCGPDLDEAKHIFCKKFSDKTKNDWSGRKKFVKVAGLYDMVKLDYTSQKNSVEEKKPAKPVKTPDSKLHPKLQALINLICDVKTMEDAVMEMKYDSEKAPLGKLTQVQIKAGYSALNKIDKCIRKKNFGRSLIEACDEFYTRIPHSFGMQRPPIIRTKEMLKAKMNLLETLEDIEVAMKIISSASATDNPLDSHYSSLNCPLAPMDSSDPMYTVIEEYLQNTHATTHNQYSMKIEEIYSVNKDSENSEFKDCGNRKLLWHGSRLTNWVGILSQGLRIAPAEAPSTGYMFGKGVYFADMSSKSANYCFPSRTKQNGLVLLCEVALGKENELLTADYKADRLPSGCDSVKGMGRIAPNAEKTYTMTDGTVVPLGKGGETGVRNPDGFTLNYNEFIVYDTKQIRMRYLLQVKFNFK